MEEIRKEVIQKERVPVNGAGKKHEVLVGTNRLISFDTTPTA
jgi:hypothetical protein